MKPRIRELADQAKMSTYLLAYGIEFNIAIEKFADLVAEQEREACAKVADRQNGDDEEDLESCVWSKAARHIAAAIRARGEK